MKLLLAAAQVLILLTLLSIARDPRTQARAEGNTAPSATGPSNPLTGAAPVPSGSPALAREVAAARRRLRELEVQFAILAGSPPPPEAQRPRKLQPHKEALLKQPAYIELLRRTKRPEVERRFGSLLHDLELTAEKRSEVSELLVDRLLAAEDARDVMPATLDWRASELIERAATNGIDDEIATFLGKELGARYRQRLAALEQEAVVKVEIGGYVAVGATPLDGNQFRELTALLAASQYPAWEDAVGRRIVDVKSGCVDPQSELSAKDRQILEAARRFLTPDQVAQLTLYFKDQNQEARLILAHGFPPNPPTTP